MIRSELFINQGKELPDTFQYTFLTKKFKNQVFYIWDNYLSQDFIEKRDRDSFFQTAKRILCEETGERELITSGLTRYSAEKEIDLCFQVKTEIDICLTLIQVIFQNIEILEDFKSREFGFAPHIAYTAKQAIDDLNHRFKENGIGYQYANKMIIRLDNELLHQETTPAVLRLISRPEFRNVNHDYSDALQHYKEGRLDDCFNDCLKAFESTIKIICDLKNWGYPANATAKPLIKVLFDNHFLPAYHQAQAIALTQMLESGVPTNRNKNSGHGAGNNQVVIGEALGSYMLYTTGATIRFLIESYYEQVT